MSRVINHSFLTLFVVLMLSLTIAAAVPDVLRESFDYPEGELSNMGAAGGGWLAPWDPATGGSVFVIAGQMQYTGIPLVGGYLEVSESGTIWRTLEETWPDDGTTYWISMLYERFDGYDVDNTYNGFSLFLGTSLELLYIGKPWASKNIGLDAHRASGALPTDVNAYSTNWLVVKLVMNGTADNDGVYLWINPDPAVEPDTSTAAVKGLWEGSNGFDMVRIGSGDAPTPCEVMYDEICLSKTYAGLTALPDGVADKPASAATFTLAANYPNPFNPTTTIAYSLDKTEHVTLEVYDLLGNKVRTLVSGQQNAGEYSLEWNATNEAGKAMASGVYVYRLVGDNRVETRKMMLLR